MSLRARRVADVGTARRFDWPSDGLLDDPRSEEPSTPYGMTSPISVLPSSSAPPASPLALADLEREAFARGHEQGERAGFEAGAQRAEAMLRRLSATIEELGSVRRSMLAQAEREMVQLALAIAKRIVRREVTIDEDLVLTIARVALERLGATSTATVRLHPQDHAIVARQDDWAGIRVAVVADSSISRGGCKIESDIGYIDATLETQFERIAGELIGDSAANHEPALVVEPA